MTIRHWFSSLLLSVLLAAVAPSVESAEPSTRPEDGDLFKGQSVDMYFYQNRFFSFDMTIPGNWHPLSTKELLRIMRKENPGGSYSEESLRETGQSFLLSISRYIPAQRGPSGEFNANIAVAATKLSKLPGIKTARDYTECLIQASGLHPKSAPHSVQLGGIEFWRADGVVRGHELTYAAYASTIRKGYVLTFQLNAGSKGDMDKLDHILKSLNFH